jgi:hypothetical protein
MHVKPWILIFGIMSLAATTQWFSTSRGDDQQVGTARAERIGTYDPRAIAIAWAHSDQFRALLSEKRSAMKAAQASHDEQAQQDLRNWGRLSRIRLHLQAFSGAPVDDILDHVRNQLPLVAADEGVQIIVSNPDFAGPDIEQVDVRDRLVELFHPTPGSLRAVDGIRKAPIVPLEQVAEMPANQ